MEATGTAKRIGGDAMRALAQTAGLLAAGWLCVSWGLRIAIKSSLVKDLRAGGSPSAETLDGRNQFYSKGLYTRASSRCANFHNWPVAFPVSICTLVRPNRFCFFPVQP